MELYHRLGTGRGGGEFFDSVNWLKGKIVDRLWRKRQHGRLGIGENVRGRWKMFLVGFRPEALTKLLKRSPGNRFDVRASNSF